MHDVSRGACTEIFASRGWLSTYFMFPSAVSVFPQLGKNRENDRPLPVDIIGMKSAA